VAEIDVYKVAYMTPVSTEAAYDALGLGQAFERFMSATPEQRAAWAEDARAERSRERQVAERRPLTLDALLDKLGFSREYAEHIVQSYCTCGDTSDGWDYCAHAYDGGVRRG
jgi:hypothetical protein